MVACPQCHVELPLKVRFCPFCGTTDPLASTTAAASGSGAEPGRVEVARDPSPPVQMPTPVLVQTAKLAETPTPQSPASERVAATPVQPPMAAPATSPAGIASSSPEPVPKPVPVVRWLMFVAVGLAATAWFARPLFGPSDPCQGSGVSSELDQARTALGARDHRTALSKSTLALTTCAQGQRADELKRIQAEAVNLSVAEGRRCLKAMDVACLERVGADLALVAQHPTAKAFNADLERDIGTRTSRDLEEARRCIAAGNIDCADQRMKLPLALRRNDTPVQALSEQLDKARAAVEAAKSCQTSSGTECVAVALEGLRQASPQSPLIKGLEQRAQLATQTQQSGVSEGAPQAAQPPAVAPPVAVLQSATPPTLSSTTATPDVRVGDRWVMQTTDHNNPQWSNSTERVVTDVSNSGMTMTSRNTRSNYKRSLTYTREWNLVSEREPTGKGATYSPPMRYLSFPLEKGKTWRAEVRKQRSDGGAEQVYSLSGEVQGVERVQVQAGVFDAVKVVLQVEIRENGTLLSQATDVSWYAPLAKRSVKTEETSQNLQRGERSTRTIELIDYSVTR